MAGGRGEDLPLDSALISRLPGPMDRRPTEPLLGDVVQFIGREMKSSLTDTEERSPVSRGP
jgi:hypothetical protein